MLRTVTIRKAPLVVAALSGFLLVGGFAPAQARNRNDKCRDRIHKAESRLERDIRKHGEHSRQAERRREELERARASCRGYPDRDHDRNRKQDRDRNYRQDRDHNHDHDNDHNNR